MKRKRQGVKGVKIPPIRIRINELDSLKIELLDEQFNRLGEFRLEDLFKKLLGR